MSTWSDLITIKHDIVLDSECVMVHGMLTRLNHKARSKDHNFVLKENQGPMPRTTSLLIGSNMDDSSVVWKYVRQSIASGLPSTDVRVSETARDL